MNTRLVAVDEWLGNDAAPLDPAAMQYRAVPATGVDGCTGCAFKGQKSKVCIAAGAAARLARMPDCEEMDVETRRTFVYVLTKLDPRQLPIPGAAQTTEE